jgi:hypothetical protein
MIAGSGPEENVLKEFCKENKVQDIIFLNCPKHLLTQLELLALRKKIYEDNNDKYSIFSGRSSESCLNFT